MNGLARLRDPLLLLPSLAFEWLVRTRNALFASGGLRSAQLAAPVVSVGNLTLGGAGKTPLAIHIAEKLSSWGLVPALLSRGYGRRSSGTLVFGPDEPIRDPSRTIGDEPALIRRRVPGTWIGISSSRVEAASEICRRIPEPVFILDDGFQHLRLRRDLDLVVIDRMQPLRENRLFPRGSLREPLGSLARAQAVILNGLDDGDHVHTVRRIRPDMPVLHCTQEIGQIIGWKQWAGAADAGACRPVQSALLVAAVGNPQRFRNDVEQCGISVKAARFFRDHHAITPEEWRQCAELAQRREAETLLTTEKDAVKITALPPYPVSVAVQRTTIAESEQLDRLLLSALQGKR